MAYPTKAQYELGHRLACLDGPQRPDRRVTDADSFLAALVDHSDAHGRYYASPALLRRLFWWETIPAEQIWAWQDDLRARGEIVSVLPAYDCYGKTPIPVIQVARKHRFPRWRRRPQIPQSVRTEVYERDGHKCVACGSTEQLTLDHVYPYSLGGQDTLENLQTMCRPCNSSKGARVA